ncbi:hypothetical protein [Burkholderia anthina]|uniref:hypothetical protein n=1 Tax=Burkholderia anthina TaxID=179879 RepID=UPI00158F2E70|nr:hypothetical protein [Burkholderia anthina]
MAFLSWANWTRVPPGVAAVNPSNPGAVRLTAPKLYIQLCLFRAGASNPCLSLIVGGLLPWVANSLEFQLITAYAAMNFCFLGASAAGGTAGKPVYTCRIEGDRFQTGRTVAEL